MSKAIQTEKYQRFMNTIKKCHECGHGPLEMVSWKGDTVPYKQYDIKISEDFWTAGCVKCGNKTLLSSDAILLDRVIESCLYCEYRCIRKQDGSHHDSCPANPSPPDGQSE